MSAPGPLRLDLALHVEDAPRLARAVADAPGRAGASGAAGGKRAVAVSIVWHDTPDAALATDGLSLAERREGRETVWRLERVRPSSGTIWAPGTPPPLLAEAASAEALGHSLPHPLVAMAGFEGQIRRLPAGGGVALTLTTGVVRAVAGEHPVCRVALEGDADAVAATARRLAQDLRLCVPADTLAADAYATALPDPPHRKLGPPQLPASLTVDEAFAFAVAHLSGVILHYAPRIGSGKATEPVHQMRVAVRRLRSILKLFGRAVACPDTDAAGTGLHALGQALGPARDWDVFGAGTALDVAAAFPDEPAVARLAAAARRERETAYAALVAFLDCAEFRQLGLTLAILAAARPWTHLPPPVAAEGEGEGASGTPAEPAREPPRTDLRAFARRALGKRHKRLLAAGGDIAALAPADLHAIRLDGKRMRYAAEIFAPLFPGRDTRRFLRRLAVLQERLGQLNDGAVAAALLDRLGQSRSFAGGVARGFVAAGAAGARERIERAWRKLRRQEAFWG